MEKEHSRSQIGQRASYFIGKIKSKPYETIAAGIVGAAITTGFAF
jgi:hypothetical protein